MRDEAVRVHLKEPDLLVVAVLCPETARRARSIHECMPTSAGLLAQGFAAAYGLAGLLSGQARINLQVSCDGPIKGLFVDADAQGHARGYVKNAQVNFLTAGGPFDAAGALGGSGVLSVLRELKAGEFYRGSIAMEQFDLARDLERHYRESEQIDTAIFLDVAPEGPERLGRVRSLFVQAMPEARRGAVEEARQLIESAGLAASAERAMDLVRPLAEHCGGEIDVLAEYPLDYVCGCSADKVLRAVLSMGREEIEDMLRREGKAVATCAFCHTTYEIGRERLQQMLEAIDESRSPEEDGEPN
ncbi:MAG TPA: Hsp33 family molecular chaperone HslO [Myxococcales bacterium]|jgi:molecular chaperone Hsp33